MNTKALVAWLGSWKSWFGPNQANRQTIRDLVDAYEIVTADQKEVIRQKQGLTQTINDQSKQLALIEAELRMTQERLEEVQADLKKSQEKYEVLLAAKEPPEVQELKDDLHKARIENELVREQLQAEMQEHHRTRGNTQRLWQFIALRHRIDLKPKNGSARDILQKAEQR